MFHIQIMLLTNCFSVDNPYKQTVPEVSIGNTQLSKTTVRNWFSFCRELCMISLEDKYTNMGKTRPHHGDWEEEIQPRTHCGRELDSGHDWQKYNRSLHNCMPEKQERCYNISEYVEAASTIHTDCWKSYNELMAGGFVAHLTVNHSHHFIKPTTVVQKCNQLTQVIAPANYWETAFSLKT